MSKANRIADYLFHLVVSCNRLAQLRSEVTQDQFLKDYRVHELALRFIESLGEAAKRIDLLDPEFFQVHDLQVVPQVIGMRNRIAHEYDGVDLVLVWHVLIDYAPQLRKAVLPVLLELHPDVDLHSLKF